MERFVLLKSLSNRMEAEMLKSLLYTYNIETIIQADDCGGTCPFASKVELLVHPRQKELALEYIDQDVEILE